MQLERLLQSQGFGSRKQCRQRILAGDIQVNQTVIDNPRADINLTDCVFTVDGQQWPVRERVYVLLHKPIGYECSRAPQRHPSVLSLLPAPLINRGLQPVGRLDEDTSGALLLSDDGDFIHHVCSPRQHLPKRYLAHTRHPVTQAQIDSLLHGVLLHGETAPVAALSAEAVDTQHLRLTIAQGLYHQVRRMIAAMGNRCEGLHREAVGGFTIEQLAEGEWRYIDPVELKFGAHYSGTASAR